MQRTVSILAAALIAGTFAFAAPKPAQAGDVGFSIHYSSPGYYGDVYWDPEPRYYGRAHYYPRERYYRYRPRGYYYPSTPSVYWSGYYAPRYYHGPRHHYRSYHRYPHHRWHRRHHRHHW